MIKVSIIIPTYNSEAYIGRCLDSVIAQSYGNIEIILIDDGSTDSTVAICDAYASKKQDMRIIQQNNGGAANARNNAIRVATGDYLAFIDSDDRVHKDYIKRLVKNALKHDADISVCSYFIEYEDGNVEARRPAEPMVMTPKDAIIDHLMERTVLEHLICNKLYRTKMILENNLFFLEGDIYEDTRTLYKMYFYANKIAYTPEPLYYYLQRNGSITRLGFKMRDFELLNLIPIETSRWLHDKAGTTYDKELFVYELTGHINTINYMLSRHNVISTAWRENRKYIVDNFSRIVFSDLVSVKRKLACVLCVLGLPIYAYARTRYDRQIIQGEAIRDK